MNFTARNLMNKNKGKEEKIKIVLNEMKTAIKVLNSEKKSPNLI